MTMKQQRLFMIALVAATLGACSSEDNEPVPQQPATQQPSTQPEARPLTITVSETPFINPDDQSGSRGTRAAITTTSTLTAFKMNYVYTSGSRATNGYEGTINVTRVSDNSWSIGDGSTGWPDIDDDNSDNIEVTWYAYSNATSFIMGATASDDYIGFTVDNSPADQHDLLVAKTSATWNNCKGNISLTFDHACSALRFLVKKATNLDAYTLAVTNIELCNVKNGGDYFFGTSTWSNLSGAASYTLFSGSSMTLPSDKYQELAQGAGPYLFLIPQELTAWNATGSPSNTYLAITCTITRISDSNIMYNDVAYIPFGFELEKGTQYDVNINIGKNSLYKVAEGVASKIITD